MRVKFKPKEEKMKLVKFFFAILISALYSQSFLSANSLTGEIIPKKQQLLKEIKSSFRVYYEYQEINGVMWEFIYDDDGKLIACHPFE